MQKKAFLTLSLIAVFFFAMACKPPTLAGRWVYNEVQRFGSPDGRLEAVLATGNSGATTSAVMLIYIVPKDGKVRFDDERHSVFGADHIKGLSVRWKNPRFLEIQFDEARIMTFKNYWTHGLDVVVEARLVPTNPESSLPAQDKIGVSH